MSENITPQIIGNLNLSGALTNLDHQLEQEEVIFWRDRLPISFCTQDYFHGLNCLLLGANYKNQFDRRWASQPFIQSLKKKTTDLEAQNILIWQDQGFYNQVKSYPMFNAHDLMLDYGYEYDDFLTTRDFLQQHLIPYHESKYILQQMLTDTLYVNTDLGLDDNLHQIVKGFLKDQQHSKSYQELDPNSKAAYLDLLSDLTLYKIAHKLDLQIEISTDPEKIIESYFRLRKNHHTRALLQIFNDTDQVVNHILTNELSYNADPQKKQKYQDPQFQIFTAILPPKASEKLNREAGKQQLAELQANMRACLQNPVKTNLYLHFVSKEPPSSDFYVSNVQDNFIFGYLITSEGTYERTYFQRDELSEIYVLDVAFKPLQIII